MSGEVMTRNPGNSAPRQTTETLSLDAAIELLESGAPLTSLCVEMNTGFCLEIGFDKGLLQRLTGHRMLTGVAARDSAAPATAIAYQASDIWIAPDVENMLAILKQA